MNILIINGPNLNFLGTRNISIYGKESLDEINEWITKQTQEKKYNLKFFQSNHEGDIIDMLQNELIWYDGVIINPGALTHYSYSIRDAIESVEKPTIEVHLSDIFKREPFRKISVISEVCKFTIVGKGKSGYLEAVYRLSKS